MSPGKRNAMLAAVFAVLLAANLLSERDALSRGDAGPLFAALRARDAMAIELVDRARGPRDPAGRVELLRTDAGWTVTEAMGYPAQTWIVDQLLAALEGLTSAELVGEEAASHDRFGVAEGGVQLRVRGSAGALLAELVCGLSNAPAERDLLRAARAVYVMPAGDVRVFRAPGLKALDTDPARWLRAPLLAIDPDLVAGVRAAWTDAGGELRALDLTRGDEGRWLGRDGAGVADDELVQRLFVSAGGLVPTSVVRLGVRPEDGIEPEPHLVLELTEKGGEPMVVEVGGPLEPGAARLATVRSAAQPWVVAVPAASAELLSADLDAIARALGEDGH